MVNLSAWVWVNTTSALSALSASN